MVLCVIYDLNCTPIDVCILLHADKSEQTLLSFFELDSSGIIFLEQCSFLTFFNSELGVELLLYSLET